MYRFARCQTHPKFPDLQGWYLILETDDIDTLMDLHRGVANLLFHKFWVDPHRDEDMIAGVCNPVHLAAVWMRSAEKLLQAGPILVNSSGGMLPPDDVKILAETQSETMSWPDIYEDEVIKIVRWPGGSHYYLSSTENRIFVPSKYVRHEDALRVAKKYTDKIQEKI